MVGNSSLSPTCVGPALSTIWQTFWVFRVLNLLSWQTASELSNCLITKAKIVPVFSSQLLASSRVLMCILPTQLFAITNKYLTLIPGGKSLGGASSSPISTVSALSSSALGSPLQLNKSIGKRTFNCLLVLFSFFCVLFRLRIIQLNRFSQSNQCSSCSVFIRKQNVT